MVTLTLSVKYSRNWVVPLLRSIRSAYNLRTLVLDISGAPLDGLNWNLLDAEICRQPLLRQVMLKGASIELWKKASSKMEGLRGKGGIICLSQTSADVDRLVIL